MPLMGYTTTVAVGKTLGEIQRLLARHGARSIQTDYDAAGEPIALAFQIETKLGPVGYRLTANIDAVLAVLRDQHDRGRVQRRFVSREQAGRVGWRILKAWIEAQLALLETRMVALDELLLPWQLVEGGITVYQAISERRYRMLPPSGDGVGSGRGEK
jgi:hypothetical protein